MPFYPTDQDLKKVREWPHADFIKLMEFVEELWAYGDWGFLRSYEGHKEVIALSTAGWSGNEEIIGALQANGMFWSMCWESSRRGGHYLFKVNEK